MTEQGYTDRPSPTNEEILKKLTELVEIISVETASRVSLLKGEIVVELLMREKGHNCEEALSYRMSLRQAKDSLIDIQDTGIALTRQLNALMNDYHAFTDFRDGVGHSEADQNLYHAVEDIFREEEE